MIIITVSENVRKNQQKEGYERYESTIIISYFTSWERRNDWM